MCATAAQVSAQQDMSKVEITHEKIAEGIYMLQGSGGNIGLSIGPDGAFMIDDQFAPLTDKITKVIAELTDQEVLFLLNTHHHGDHTGGNENMGKRGANIVAHENVRKRLNADGLVGINASDAPNLPIVTFSQDVTFHMNGNTIQVIHMPHAHTDGDAIIFFQEANVFHMGDTFFNGRFPYIDLGGGGSVDGLLAVGHKVLDMSNESTKIIPGHGPTAARSDLENYLKVVKKTRDLVYAAKAEGKSEDEVVAANPLADFPAEWGSGFMSTERYTRILYKNADAHVDDHVDQHAVRSVVDKLFAGMLAGDSTMVRSVFYEGATLHSNVQGPNGPARRGVPIDAFVNAVGTPHDLVWDEKIWDVEIRVNGLMADAWMNYAFYLGEDLSHCGVNSFELFKSDDGWKVTTLADTRQQAADCVIPEGVK